MMSNWMPILAMFLSVLGLLFAFAKWLIGWAEKRDEQQEASFNNHINDMKQELRKVNCRVDDNRTRLSETREKMQSQYVRHTEIEGWRKEIREDFKSVFQKMGGIDRSVNQLIGTINGKFKHD